MEYVYFMGDVIIHIHTRAHISEFLNYLSLQVDFVSPI